MEDAAQILTAIGAQLERAAALSAVALELSAELAKLRGVGVSEDDTATVRVDHQGLVIDVALSDDGLERGGPHVAAAILEATRLAIEDVQRQAEPLRAAILQPHETPMREDLGDRIDDLFRQVEEAERMTAGGAAPETNDREEDR